MPVLEKAPPSLVEPDHEPELDSFDAPVDLSKIQERHPDWPKLELSFYLSAHGNKRDIEGVAASLEEADILLFESVSPSKRQRKWLQEDIDEMNRLSVDPNNNSVESFLKDRSFSYEGTIFEPLANGVYGSGKAVGSIDIGRNPAEHELVVQLMESKEDFITNDYESTLKNFSEGYKEFAKLQREREKLMVNSFEEEVEKILASRPDLNQKEMLKILITMGAVHTTLRHTFAEAGLNSDRNFSAASPYMYDYKNEMIRSYMYGKEPSPDLIKKAFATALVDAALVKTIGQMDIDFDEQKSFTRNFVSHLDEQEMQELFDLLQTSTFDSEAINKLFQGRGKPLLPNNVSELRTLNRIEKVRKSKKVGGVAVSS